MNRELLVAILLIVVITALTTPAVPYLRDFDTWYHYRIAEYTFEQGFRPPFDPLSNMGERIIYPPLLHYLLAIPAHLPGLNLMLVAQLYPPIAALLTLVFVFLFAKEIFNERTAMLSALLLAALPVFKAMTSFGFCDHDPLDYLLIFSALFFFVKAIKRERQPATHPSASFALGSDGWAEVKDEEQQIEKPKKQNFICYALAGVSIGLFALTWVGFPLMIVLLSAFMLLSSLLNSHLKLLDKDMVTGFLILSVISTGIASLWYGADMLPILLVEIFSAAFSFLALKLENSSRALPVLIVVLLCSLPVIYLFRGWLVDVGLTYIGLRDKGVYLEYVAELRAPNLSQFSQLYGVQLLPFILGLGLFITSTKEFKRETLLLLFCIAFFIFLASTAIRFIQYFGVFVSILSAYLLSKLSEVISASLKKDIFIPLMLLSAVLFIQPLFPVLPTMTFAVSDDWYSSLQWLKENSNEGDVVMSWWDYSQWVNGIAERKTVVNNQPPGRFDDSMVFFGTNDWERAKGMLEKYNVSYVAVSRGTLVKIYIAEKFLDEKIEFEMAQPVREGSIYSLRFGNKFRTYYDPVSRVAWDEYSGGRKVYYREVGLFNDELYKTQYLKADVAGAEFNDDYIFMFSNLFIRIPEETKRRVFFNLMYTNSSIPYLQLVKEAGEVRVYKVLR